MSELNLTYENRNDPESGAEGWAETMWPLDQSILHGLPDQLWPESDELHDLQYPWELLNSLNKVRVEQITETLGEDDVIFEDRDLTYIEGPVWFAPGVHVRALSKIYGPAYVGGDVGSFGLVRNSMLGEDSHVGSYCEVKGSVLGERAVTSHRNGVLDSIVGSAVHLAGGVRTGNIRRDGETIRTNVNGEKIDTGLRSFGTVIGSNTEIGPNGFTMPGKFIGRQSVIGAGVTVYSHIPDDILVENPPIEPIFRSLK